MHAAADRQERGRHDHHRSRGIPPARPSECVQADRAGARRDARRSSRKDDRQVRRLNRALMGQVALLFLIVFAIHLAPAFTPPTWPVIALYALNTNLPMPLLVITAAIAAAIGRYVLGRATRLFEHRFPARLRKNLD